MVERRAVFALPLALLVAAPWVQVSSLAQAEAKIDVPADWVRAWPRTDFSRLAVAPHEIRSGGPPKDGIPSIDEPRFRPAASLVDELPATEPVMTVVIDGDARAYPLRVLIWHEIVNDTVGGRPVAVTFCPLCNSGVVFDRTVAGAATTFGTTGKLRASDLVMYDRATESWWQQFEGRAIVGARTGATLERLPARLESFERFRDRHPTGQVLVPSAGAARDYGRNPYAGYDSAPRPFLYDGRYDGPGVPLMRVVAVAGADRAWSLELLRQEGRIEHGPWVLSWTPGQNSALDTARIGDGRDVGNVVVRRRDGDGQLVDAVYDVPFAFAYRAFNPDQPIRHVD
ncbi:MAG: DUF3179 domain-containing protein [Pseudomonadota bacterium]